MGAYDLTQSELEQHLALRFGDQSRTILKSFAHYYPNARPFDLLSAIGTASIRRSALDHAGRKAAQGAAPAYLYLLSYYAPTLDGRMGAYHAAEITFVFNNLESCPNLTGGDPRHIDCKNKSARPGYILPVRGIPIITGCRIGLPLLPAEPKR